MSVSSFDFDKFSLSSDDESSNEEYTQDKKIKNSKKHEDCSDDEFNNYEIIENYIYDAEIDTDTKVKKTKENNANTFLILLNEEKQKLSVQEYNKTKYMLNISSMNIPRYIMMSQTNKPCKNCGINIEQKITHSFIKILEKDYFLCFVCKDKFLKNLNFEIEKQFIKMKSDGIFNLEIQSGDQTKCAENKICENFEKTTNYQKYNINKFGILLENFLCYDLVEKIINDILEKAFNNIKFNKPYLNIKIYDFNMGDYRFTNMSRIKSLLKSESVIKIDEDNYKFTKEEFGNHYEYKAKAENKCICCNTEFNLLKFKLAIAKHNVKINHIIKKYENLHYLLYSVCTLCQKLCDKIQNDCITYFVKLNKLKNFDQVIDLHTKNATFINFIKEYNDKFFELLKLSEK
jgi:hypothetical protein